MGDQDNAAQYFEVLLNLSEGSKSQRTEIEEAKTFLKADVI